MQCVYSCRQHTVFSTTTVKCQHLHSLSLPAHFLPAIFAVLLLENAGWNTATLRFQVRQLWQTPPPSPPSWQALGDLYAATSIGKTFVNLRRLENALFASAKHESNIRLFLNITKVSFMNRKQVDRLRDH